MVNREKEEMMTMKKVDQKLENVFMNSSFAKMKESTFEKILATSCSLIIIAIAAYLIWRDYNINN